MSSEPKERADGLMVVLGSYLENFAVDVADRTSRTYRGDIRHFVRVVGDPAVSEVTAETFTRYRTLALAQSLSPETIESRINTICTILRYACNHLKSISVVPSRGRRLKVKRKPPVMPTVEQVGAIYNAADCARWPDKLHVPAEVFWRCWIATAYFTGLRLEDLMFNLRWEQFTDQGLFITARKTGRDHAIPVHPVLRRHLDQIHTSAGDGRVFSIKKCKKQILREMRRMSKAAGVAPGVTTKQLRRVACTQWERAKSGAGSLLLGHSLGVTQYYLGVIPELLVDASEKLILPEPFLTGSEHFEQAEREARESELKRNRRIEPFPLPDPTEWEFHGGRFRYRDSWYELRNESLRVLRLLVTAGRPVNFREVAAAAYNGRVPADERLQRRRTRAATCRLRSTLRELFSVSKAHQLVVNVQRGNESSWAIHIPAWLGR